MGNSLTTGWLATVMLGMVKRTSSSWVASLAGTFFIAIPIISESTGLQYLTPNTTVFGMSGDGNVVVGWAVGLPPGRSTAFRATTVGAPESLGALNGGGFSAAFAASYDGSVVVGSTSDGAASNPQWNEAFVWTRSNGMVSLHPTDGNVWSQALGVSGDGRVIVGRFDRTPGYARAFRWTRATGLTELAVPGDRQSIATGVSFDGSTIVGTTDTATGSQAFRWKEGQGAVLLGTLNAGSNSWGEAVNRDGRVVVGSSDDGSLGSSARYAFRWTAQTGMVSLGSLGYLPHSEARAVSADGNVIVGKSDIRAFRWSASGGMQSVLEWLGITGVTPDNDPTFEAVGVSADGNTVVGNAKDSRTFIARISPIGSGIVTMDRLQSSLSDTVTSVSQLEQTASVALHGLHSRPLARRAAPGKTCLWSSGDVGSDDHGVRDGTFSLAEIGACREVGYGVHTGIAIGRSSQRSGTASSRVRGESRLGVIEAIMNLPGSRIWPSLALLHSRGDASIFRLYAEGSESAGIATTTSTAARMRLDWEAAVVANGWSFSPYIDATSMRSRVGAYTEIGGGFPARFDERLAKSTEFRFGSHVSKTLTSTTTLTGRLEAVRRNERSGVATRGEVLGLIDFDLPAQRRTQDFARIGIGLDASFLNGMVSAMASMTNSSPAPDRLLTVSFGRSF